jgi:hypothetical protein
VAEGTSSSGYVGQIISSVQGIWGHPKGSGTMAGRALQQIALAGYRFNLVQAALARRRFEESLEPRYYGQDVLEPLIQPDLPPVALSTRLTRAQQAYNLAGTTPGGRDDRLAARRVTAAEGKIAHWQKKHPDAYSVLYVTHK